MLKQSKYFRLSVTEHCNLSCYFCHNEGQKITENRNMSLESIVFVCRIAKEEGFTKFKITGGEPTIRTDICDLIKELSSLQLEDLSMITNGSMLIDQANSLKQSGLQRLNVTLNTLDYEKFKKIYGADPAILDKILKGIDFSLEAGFTNMKINFVYMGEESDSDLNDMLEYVQNRSLILAVLPIISFEECVKSSNHNLESLYDKFKKMSIRSEKSYIDNEGIHKRIIELDSGAKVILRKDELVDHRPYDFCSRCTKKSLCKEGIFPLRLSAAGTLIPCLASTEHRISIREAIESFDESAVLSAIHKIRGWKTKGGYQK